MKQGLSYCTARLFQNGFVPLVALRPTESRANNDNEPLVLAPSVWS